MGILDDLFGRNYAVDKVPSPKEMMENALGYSVQGDSTLQYISTPQDTANNS